MGKNQISQNRGKTFAALLAALLMLAGCATTGQPAVPAATLAVQNDAGGHVGVYLNAHRVGTAYSGLSCIRLWVLPAGRSRFGFQPTAEPREYAPAVNLRDSVGWSVRLDHNLKFALLSLEPAPRC